uniref:Uncharacterized protein n=2 Tax=unclassified Caudoviricetes TaxID=2788787 RepID=A0A8S5VBB9_9CAUD|nr:MAG TPA: hypothetical protein [Siphoviridae sp. ctfrT39]DAG03984.1 MAG TPA: hypothetical protein [Siphoviridae sp. ct0vA12]
MHSPIYPLQRCGYVLGQKRGSLNRLHRVLGNRYSLTPLPDGCVGRFYLLYPRFQETDGRRWSISDRENHRDKSHISFRS